MPRFAANLSLMFTEHPFLDRFDAAAEAGFDAVEFLFPYEHPADAIAERLRRNDLAPALFNTPPGDWERGERGTASVPGRSAEFREGIERALDYAGTTGTRRLHLMAGQAASDDPAAASAFRRSVEWAADRAVGTGVTFVLEPINGRDVPGYFLDDFDRAEAVIAAVARPNVRLQFDIYHRQILHGDVTVALRRAMAVIGHIQIASVPSRNEPDGEELNLPFLFAELDRLGYDGFVGCEYRPRAGTLDGLGWFAPYARRSA